MAQGRSHGEEASSSPAASSLHTSFLGRLQAQDEEAWRQLDYLYGPVVFGWLRGAGISPDDAADVRQEVFRAAAAAIARVRRERPGDSFRGWLWRIAQNKVRDFFRREQRQAPGVGGSDFQRRLHAIPAAADESSPPPSTDEEKRDFLQRALAVLQEEFQPRTWQAFWRTTIDEQPAAVVAAELGMKPGAVYTAKSRVLQRLRQWREELGESWES